MPDANGFAATQKALELVQGLTAGDTVEVRVLCDEDETSTMTVTAALLREVQPSAPLFLLDKGQLRPAGPEGAEEVPLRP